MVKLVTSPQSGEGNPPRRLSGRGADRSRPKQLPQGGLLHRTIGMGDEVEHAPRVLVAPLVPLAVAFCGGDRGRSLWRPLGDGGMGPDRAAGIGRSWSGALAAPVRADLRRCSWSSLALGGGWHHACWSDLAPDDLARSVSEEPRPAWVRGVLRDVLGIYPGDPGLTRAVLEVTSVRDGAGWRTASGRALLVIVGAPARPGRRARRSRRPGAWRAWPGRSTRASSTAGVPAGAGDPAPPGRR